MESARPRIVSPMPDAVVWGQFAVGVEVFDAAQLPPEGTVSPVTNPSTPAASPTATPVARVVPAVARVGASPSPGPSASPDASPTPAVSSNTGPVLNAANAAAPTVQLRLPDGRVLDPVAVTGPESGPVRHYQFNVPADSLAAGTLPLVALSIPPGFTEVDRRAGRGAPLESQPLILRNRPQTVRAEARSGPANARSPAHPRPDQGPLCARAPVRVTARSQPERGQGRRRLRGTSRRRCGNAWVPAARHPGAGPLSVLHPGARAILPAGRSRRPGFISITRKPPSAPCGWRARSTSACPSAARSGSTPGRRCSPWRSRTVSATARRTATSTSTATNSRALARGPAHRPGPPGPRCAAAAPAPPCPSSIRRLRWPASRCRLPPRRRA